MKIGHTQHNMPYLQDCILQNLDIQKQVTTWPQKRIKKSASARPLEGPINAAEAKQVRQSYPESACAVVSVCVRARMCWQDAQKETKLQACATAQLGKVKYRTKEQGQMTVLAKRLRKQGGVPAYKSWSYLMHNEQANETGGRVFYTDATGAVLAAVHTLLAVRKDLAAVVCFTHQNLHE